MIGTSLSYQCACVANCLRETDYSCGGLAMRFIQTVYHLMVVTGQGLTLVRTVLSRARTQTRDTLCQLAEANEGQD